MTTAIPASRLPTWPMTAMFGFFPLWWVVGVVDVAWIPLAAVLTLYMIRAQSMRVPRGFGLWLLFLGWSACSAIFLDQAGDLIGFIYRFCLYVAAAIMFLYVYNARTLLTKRYVSGVLTSWWLTVVVGGYLGLLFPTAVVRTPMSYLVPQGLLGNDLVNHMVIRRFAQFNPESFLQVPPRPSAPFLYTNNWGNVYSLLLPFVIVYLLEVRGRRRFPLLVAVMIASVVPAVLTLNRGMFIGIGLSLVYVAGRLALRGRFRSIAGLVALVLVGYAVFMVLPVEERLESRLEGPASSTATRSSLYFQALALVPDSPVFGHGAPQPSPAPYAPPVGTQGQLWMLLVSHGPVATALFFGFFLVAYFRSWRRTDAMGLACNTVLLVGVVEMSYYGVLPNGLPLLMVAAAMALRPPEESGLPMEARGARASRRMATPPGPLSAGQVTEIASIPPSRAPG